MSLLKMIAAYDEEREAYIADLQAENERLKEQLHEASALMMRGERLRERTMLDAILAGAYTKPEVTPVLPGGGTK